MLFNQNMLKKASSKIPTVCTYESKSKKSSSVEKLFSIGDLVEIDLVETDKIEKKKPESDKIEPGTYIYKLKNQSILYLEKDLKLKQIFKYEDTHRRIKFDLRDLEKGSIEVIFGSVSFRISDPNRFAAVLKQVLERL